MTRASSLSPSPGECPSEEAVQALTSVRRALSRIMQAFDSSSLVQALDSYSSVPSPARQTHMGGYGARNLKKTE